MIAAVRKINRISFLKALPSRILTSRIPGFFWGGAAFRIRLHPPRAQAGTDVRQGE